MSGDLGQRLQSVRKRRGLTQRELAVNSAVSVSLIRKIEQRERDDTRIETLRRLAVALGCPLTVPPGLRPTSDNRKRHLLDVAQAHLDLGRPEPGLDILLRLSGEARPWLIEQRLAKDLLARLIGRRRTLTPDMRALADLIRLEY